MHDEPKLKDSLGRSWRFAPPEDDGKFFALGQVGLEVVDVLDDHGPLPTSYLWRVASKTLKDETRFKKWLKRAYIRKNTPDGGAYITRPSQQKAAYRADRQELTHDNADAARRALERDGRPVHPKRTDHMHHRFMNSTILCSLRFACEEVDHVFVRFKDILNRHTFPAARKDLKNPFAFQTKPGLLVPDDLCGIGYKIAEKIVYRFIAWEQDRATETLEAIEFKVLCYLDMLRTHSYEEAWGIRSPLYIAIVTTAPQRMQNMLTLLEKVTKKEPAFRAHFLFKCKRIFHEEWLVPPIMTDILTEPWERTGLPPFSMEKL